LGKGGPVQRDLCRAEGPVQAVQQDQPPDMRPVDFAAPVVVRVAFGRVHGIGRIGHRPLPRPSPPPLRVGARRCRFVLVLVGPA